MDYKQWENTDKSVARRHFSDQTLYSDANQNASITRSSWLNCALRGDETVQ